jgi:maleylacetoacetate isomerase/maleylpyruvate isomerase
MTLTLHSAKRASAPYRVRIGLNLKGLTYDVVPVDLLKGEQRDAPYKAMNPQGLTPTLIADDDQVLTQSLAILEWLEETHPEPALLPKAAGERAIVRAMAAIIACDIHPINNLRILQQLAALGVDENGRNTWARRWIGEGFEALEPMVAKHGDGFAFGDAPTFVDVCLVPQVYNAARFDFDLSPFPAIARAAKRAADHPAFVAAHPDRQPDAVHA